MSQFPQGPVTDPDNVNAEAAIAEAAGNGPQSLIKRGDFREEQQ